MGGIVAEEGGGSSWVVEGAAEVAVEAERGIAPPPEAERGVAPAGEVGAPPEASRVVDLRVPRTSASTCAEEKAEVPSSTAAGRVFRVEG